MTNESAYEAPLRLCHLPRVLQGSTLKSARTISIEDATRTMANPNRSHPTTPTRSANDTDPMSNASESDPVEDPDGDQDSDDTELVGWQITSDLKRTDQEANHQRTHVVHSEARGKEPSIEEHLSDLVRSFSVAINARQFDTTKSPWIDKLDLKFAGVPSKTPSAKRSGALNATEYVEHLCNLVKKHPEYRIEIERIDCYKDPAQGLAHAFLNYDVTGVPPGVTRKSVAIFKLRRNAGNVWRCYNVQSADGMAGSEGGISYGY